MNEELVAWCEKHYITPTVLGVMIYVDPAIVEGWIYSGVEPTEREMEALLEIGFKSARLKRNVCYFYQYELQSLINVKGIPSDKIKELLGLVNKSMKKRISGDVPLSQEQIKLLFNFSKEHWTESYAEKEKAKIALNEAKHKGFVEWFNNADSTAADVAALFGVTVNLINRWRSGMSLPSEGHEEMLKKLGVNPWSDSNEQ